MAIQKVNPVAITPSSRNLVGGSSPEPTPFRVYLTGTNPAAQLGYIKVSRYSAVLASPDISDRVPIVGIDLQLEITYGDKVWLEIFYDKNLVPVFGLVRVGKKWRAKTINPGKTSETVEVYPKEQEFITKGDLSNKVAELDATLALINTYQGKAQEELSYKQNNGVVTSSEYTTLLDSTNAGYQKVKDLVSAYKNKINTFFDASPTALWKKLIRTYSLIAYTTHEKDSRLDGTEISTTQIAPTTSPSVPQASKPLSFKVVQCLYSDLYLADMCYQNRYPAKLPIPFHRPVYVYYDNGKEEDKANAI